MFPSHISEKELVFFLLFLSFIYKAQDYSFLPKDVQITAEYYNRGEFEKSLNFNINALEQYQKQNNKDGIVTVYTNIAYLLFSFHKLKESIHYLDRAKKEMKGDDNPLFQARIYNEYAKNYTKLGMLSQSNINFNKAIKYANKIPDAKQKRYLLFYSYTWKRLNFLNQGDSLESIDKKSLKIMPSAITYKKIADHFIMNKKQLDSAEYYLNKARLAPDENIIAIKGITLLGFGNLYTVKGEHEKALEYYLGSLSAFQKAKFKNFVRTAYDSISGSYKSLNNIEKSHEYLRKFKSINDSIKKEEKEAIDIVVAKLLEEKKEEEKNKERKRLYVSISIIIAASLGLIYFIRHKYVKKQRKKDQLIEKQSQETDKLKKQVNESFDKIIKLAETGSPFFLARFKEVYPDFYQKLTDRQNELTDYELRLCAYMRLNLTAKEIAQYENITLRAAEARKYRLKKKLNLSQNIELAKWILEL
jgi:DNA-binding CsgD family transcriptional regulator